ncbi:hypothetical protein [Achromobacter phage Motura]|uniref:Uncharacterized protein n=1 Tax=Achromobacter phage Motura TaxID=2591403 RepID=A0A514CT57_9CAUD|nr:hypothetical protein H1O15_gp095 [Achromobacter phage Motura]QDH83655.1 hypothetical protein [Achromobacter phage Motura]
MITEGPLRCYGEDVEAWHAAFKAAYLQYCQNDWYSSTTLDPKDWSNRAGFMVERIMNLTTYGSGDEDIARKMIEVLDHLWMKTPGSRLCETTDYILMCNVPWLYRFLEWGTSIRGAWLQLNPPKPAVDNKRQSNPYVVFNTGESFSEQDGQYDLLVHTTEELIAAIKGMLRFMTEPQ